MKLQAIYERYIGEIGRYQVWVVCLMLAVRSPSIFHNMGFVFFARTPDHWCSFPRDPDANLSEETWKQLWIPSEVVSGKREFKQCKLYDRPLYRNLGNGTLPAFSGRINTTSESDDVVPKCERWDYDTWTDVSRSLVTEWDLVCDRAWMTSLIAALYVAGWITGTPIAGYFCDRYGRRKTIQITSVLMVIFGFLNCFCNTFWLFVVCRFFVSAFGTSAFSCAYTAALEEVGASWRSFVSNVFMTIWALGYMSLAGVAYLVRDYFTMLLIISVPAFLLLPLLWFVPETVAWLVAKGRKEEAEAAIRKIAKYNKRPIPDDVTLSVEKEKDKTSTNIKYLVATPFMRKCTFVLGFNWFTNGLVFYAISWNAIALHGNLYLNVFLAGFIEIPAYCLNILALQKLGRRLSIVGCTILSGLALLISLGIPKSSTVALATLTLTSKFFITMSFTGLFQFTTELYPTVIRSLGLVTANTCARFGVLLAPYMPLMVTEDLSFKELPQLICGVLALVAGASLLVLPETLHRPLPASIEEAEKMDEKETLRDRFRLPTKAHVDDLMELPEKVGLQEKDKDQSEAAEKPRV